VCLGRRVKETGLDPHPVSQIDNRQCGVQAVVSTIIDPTGCSVVVKESRSVSKIRVFEGPLCCNTGVCGTDVDQKLVDFTADVHWATSQGADVVRANLAQDAVAFSQNPVVMQFVQTVGVEGLPLVLLDDHTVMTGRFPTRDELAKFAGLALAATSVKLALVESTSCCGGPAPSEASASGCCGQ